jgi:hypothetical protein
MKIAISYLYLPFIGQINKSKNKVLYNTNIIILKSKYNKYYKLIKYIPHDSSPYIILNYYFNEEEQEEKKHIIYSDKIERKNESLLLRYITNLVNLLY